MILTRIQGLLLTSPQFGTAKLGNFIATGASETHRMTATQSESAERMLSRNFLSEANSSMRTSEFARTRAFMM